MAGNAHHVLVIEDDAETAEQLVDCVRTNGYAVDLSMDGEDAAKRSRSASPGLLAYLGSRDGCGYFHLAALGRAGRSDQCDGEVIADLDEILRNFSSLLRITLIETRDRMAAFRKNWIFRELVPALRKSRRRASEPTAYWFRKPNPICPASGNPPLATIAMAGEGMSKRISLVTAASLVIAMGLRVSDGWAQYYIGAQAGWTALPYQTDTIDGLGSVPVQFTAGYNVGVRGGYQLGPWRFEEEYSYRHNDLAEYDEITNGISGNRHTHSIMTNVVYDFTTGWPITPHIGVGIGAMNVFDSVRVPGSGQVFSDSNWQFGYQAIAGLRYDINSLLALDLDFRYLATTESTFRIPRTSLRYRTGANTNNFVASVTYRFGPPSPTSPVASPAPPLP